MQFLFFIYPKASQPSVDFYHWKLLAIPSWSQSSFEQLGPVLLLWRESEWRNTFILNRFEFQIKHNGVG